jgi:murein DD-endopeptidase MepM/ murein hydrolase activator NlpD
MSSFWLFFQGYGKGISMREAKPRRSAPFGALSLPLPENFRISSGFGQRRDPVTDDAEHCGGIDVAAPEGMPILRSADGVRANRLGFFAN